MTEPTACLGCGYRFDTETRIDGADVDPVEGDVSICIQCGMVALFTGSGREIRLPTRDEFEGIMADPVVRQMASEVYEARRQVVERGRLDRMRAAGRRGLN